MCQQQRWFVTEATAEGWQSLPTKSRWTEATSPTAFPISLLCSHCPEGSGAGEGRQQGEESHNVCS